MYERNEYEVGIIIREEGKQEKFFDLERFNTIKEALEFCSMSDQELSDWAFNKRAIKFWYSGLIVRLSLIYLSFDKDGTPLPIKNFKIPTHLIERIYTKEAPETFYNI